jgi:hypothetical protein
VLLLCVRFTGKLCCFAAVASASQVVLLFCCGGKFLLLLWQVVLLSLRGVLRLVFFAGSVSVVGTVCCSLPTGTETGH